MKKRRKGIAVCLAVVLGLLPLQVYASEVDMDQVQEIGETEEPTEESSSGQETEESEEPAEKGPFREETEGAEEPTEESPFGQETEGAEEPTEESPSGQETEGAEEPTEESPSGQEIGGMEETIEETEETIEESPIEQELWETEDIPDGILSEDNIIMETEELFVQAEGDIEINEENFPDENFRKYLLERIEDKTMSADRRLSITSIDCRNRNISDLTGIEYFPNLRNLYCLLNNLESLDVSKNVKLEILDCRYNRLSNLDCSNNPYLRELYCSVLNAYGKISNLNVSKNDRLEVLDCSNQMELESLDLSGKPDLKILRCGTGRFGSAKLRSLDLSKNPKLEELDCHGLDLGSLDLSGNPALKILNCQNNNLSSLDLSGNPALESLSCGDASLLHDSINNKLVNIDLSHNPALKDLSCQGINLSSLDLSGNPALESLTCYNNNLVSLDLSHNPALRRLNCDNNKLSSLDVGACQTLMVFSAVKNVVYTAENQIDMIKRDARFDAGRVSNLQNLDFNGGIFRIIKGEEGTYDYDCGNGHSMTVTIKVGEVNEADEVKTREFVARMYRVALNREAEEAGLNDWTQKLVNGDIDASSFSQGVIMSEEFTNRKLNDSDFLDVLYKAFFDRAADKEGKSNWQNKIENGVSREYVLAGFVNSTEFENLCKSYGIKRGEYKLGNWRDQNEGVTMFVNRIYTKALGRAGEPDGLEDWTGRILRKEMSPEDVAKSFFFSEEFANKKTDNTEFVKVLYRTFMGREYDQSGLEDWVGELDAGTSREKVLEGFSRSTEFDNIMKQYGL